MRSSHDGTRASRSDTINSGDDKIPGQRSNAAPGASAAGVRAVSAQLITFYFRAPIKAFFKTRFDYTAYARAINPNAQSNQGWSWRVSTPGLLAHAVREYGWSFIPHQVLPPMLANVTVGAILYTTYLQTLGAFHEPAQRQSKRVYPPPPILSVAKAGFVAGAAQSIAAAPLDALQVRFNTSDMLEGQYKSMWQYAGSKLREIGIRGVFAGWGLSFIKDSTGFALFFATFECVKSQGYYSFVRRWYGDYKPRLDELTTEKDSEEHDQKPVLRPHYAIEPVFLLLAGVSASITQQTIQYPISNIQQVHYGRLESIDYATKLEKPGTQMLSLYYRAYEKTFQQCKVLASKAGGWRRWLYGGVIWNTIRQVPSTAAGLIIFELVRRRYATDADLVRIHKDGYDILLA